MSVSFRFHPVATLAMLIGAAILLGLGTWQLQRRAWKLELIAAVQSRANQPPRDLALVLAEKAAATDQRYAAVTVQGAYDHNREFHVFGTLDGAPGYYVFTLFVPSSEGQQGLAPVFVNRGFVPQDLKDPDTRANARIEGEFTLTGLLREPEQKPLLSRWLSPTNVIAKNIWYVRDPSIFVSQSPHLFAMDAIGEVAGERALLPSTDFYIDSSGAENTGTDYPKGGTTRIAFNNRHLDYALTWYGLAVTLIGVWLAFSLRRM